MNNTDTTFLGERDGESRLGNGIHRGRDERNIQSNVPRQAAFKRNIFCGNVGITGYQQYVIEGESFFCDSQHQDGLPRQGSGFQRLCIRQRIVTVP